MRMVLVLALLAASGCTPVRVAGDIAVGTGQVVLGAADLVL